MHRGSLIVVFIGLLLSGPGQAEELTLCKFTCGEERRVCNSKALEMAKLEGKAAFPIERYRHSMATNASKLQSPSSADEAIQRSSLQKSRGRHVAACDDSFARCTRACTNPAAKSADSPVIVRKREAN